MKFGSLILLFSIFIKQFSCLCVLDSDFGFAVNCNFKKSGMFRVRNLGGLKAHFGLGFSLGDELGFPESLGNVEGSRKRSLDVRPGGGGNAINNEFSVPSIQDNRQFLAHSFESKVSPQTFDSIPQGFTINKPVLMTEALTLPLGVPRFKKLPKNIPEVPKFQFQPKFELKSLTKVENSNDDTLQIDLKGHTIEELAVMANVSVDVIKSAIKLRQQQLKKIENNEKESSLFSKENFSTKTIRTTQPWLSSSTTTSKTSPVTTTQSTTLKTTYVPKKKMKKQQLHNGHKIFGMQVMNAPKEYYPSGYDKDFDDNFKSKVDLPATSFLCGDQKHFPGLYADQDLGCMVFHVCALTDEGLVMKSFLCPENTLFDQTILKCNWWFYSDCKSSKSLYDSNLPMSKSYQLMKSLSFFNKNYKAHNAAKELETIKESDFSKTSIVVE